MNWKRPSVLEASDVVWGVEIAVRQSSPPPAEKKVAQLLLEEKTGLISRIVARSLALPGDLREMRTGLVYPGEAQ